MLKISMTPNLLGFKIAGDYNDLNELYDAVWNLSISDGEFPDDPRPSGSIDEILMSTRLLALCYDLRHAYQGDRNIELVDSGLGAWAVEQRDLPFVEKNVEFSVEVLYPEAMYEAMVLVYLSSRRTHQFTAGLSRRTGFGDSVAVLLDKDICTARLYIAKLLSAVEIEATPGRAMRIRNKLEDDCSMIPGLYQQWVDVLNEDYVMMSRKKRAESLSTIVRDLAEFHRNEQYLGLAADVAQFTLNMGISRDNVRIPGLYEWDNPEW